jgi:imidazoleglycerol phosphate dehydratase HisB
MMNAQNAPEGTYSAEIGFEEPTAWQDHKRAEDRLWLAGMAMQALIRDDRDMRMIAEQAWAMADAMLEVGGY